MKTYDSVVIGGGPAGITAALYLLRSGVKTALVEKLAPGGQILLTEEIENYPGFPKGIQGWELVDAMAAHLDKHEELDRFTDEVRAFEHAPGKNRLQIGDEWIEARSVVVCSGAVFRKLGLEREKELTGRGVSYCALCDGNFYRGKDVAVIGGGNTALEESLYLTKLVNKVHLVHRRCEFRGDRVYQEKVTTSDKIECHYEYTVSNLLGDKELTGIELEHCHSGEKKNIEVDGCFIFIGYEPTSGYLPEGIEKNEAGFVLTDSEMRTNLPGVFAAGDIRAKLCRQVATAVGDGATAANSAFLWMEQEA